MMLRYAIQQTRQYQYRRKAIWTAFCNSLFFFVIGLLLWSSWEFKFYDNSGVIGWVSENQYPKQQEMIAYVGAFISIAVGIVAGWLIWCVLAIYHSSWRNSTLSQSLHCAAWIFSGYAYILIPLLRGNWTPFQLLLIPLASVLLSGIIIWFLPCSNSGSSHYVKKNDQPDISL